MGVKPEALTTIEAVKEQLDITGDSEDGILVSFIEAATAAVETYCRRRFAYDASVTESLSLKGDTLFLRRPPIESVSEVLHGDRILPPEQYKLLNEGGLLMLARPWGGTYTVTYAGGFITPNQANEQRKRTLPRDVELATLLVVTTLYRNKGRDPNVTAESLLGARQAFTDGGWHVISPAAQALLAPWRLV